MNRYTYVRMHPWSEDNAELVREVNVRIITFAPYRVCGRVIPWEPLAFVVRSGDEDGDLGMEMSGGI